KKHTITVDELACVGCGACAADCPANNMKLNLTKAAPVTQDCMMCGHCVAICPVGAISISGFAEDSVPVPEDVPVILDPDALGRALRFRRSVRKFAHKDVPRELVERIIEAGRLTPTAVNAQKTAYYVIADRRAEIEAEAVKLFQKLLPAAKIVLPAARGMKQIPVNFFFMRAPLAIVVTARNQVDAGLAAANMMLMAESQGLAGFFSGFFTMAVNRSGKLKQMLGFRKGEKAVTTLVLGWPSIKYRRSPQREKAKVRWL
ncbi:MAG: nitroreductase family protein, partial [Lachnospiraceae bacterium]|nr:nitroreductase family protein [Lachnospiraceae bacterium]